jgi:hypothetical protein
MAGYRFWLQVSLTVVLVLATAQVGRAQIEVPSVFFSGPLYTNIPTCMAGPTCKIYSLSDLGDDPKLCKWVADTIPDMIQPATWKQSGVKLSYYAPSKILVVSNTPAVHAQVEEFLQNLRKSMPQQKALARHDASVVPAQFAVPDGTRSVQAGPSSYPVPTLSQGPKHLFHFIIRYEGEGIIDSNVVKFAKALQASASSGAQTYGTPPATSYVLQPPPPPVIYPASNPPYSPYPPVAPNGYPPSNSPPMMPAADGPATSSSGQPLLPPPLNDAPQPPITRN